MTTYTCSCCRPINRCSLMTAMAELEPFQCPMGNVPVWKKKRIRTYSGFACGYEEKCPFRNEEYVCTKPELYCTYQSRD